jgi:hypothetical protein
LERTGGRFGGARAEAAARTGEQHCAHRALALDGLGAVAQVAQQAEREAVELRRAVQHHLHHVARLLAGQVLELHSALLVSAVARRYDRMIRRDAGFGPFAAAKEAT